MKALLDLFAVDAQLSEENRMVRDSVRGFARNTFEPRVAECASNCVEHERGFGPSGKLFGLNRVIGADDGDTFVGSLHNVDVGTSTGALTPLPMPRISWGFVAASEN